MAFTKMLWKMGTSGANGWKYWATGGVNPIRYLIRIENSQGYGENYFKKDEQICYYAIAKYNNGSSDQWLPFFISPDRNAVYGGYNGEFSTGSFSEYGRVTDSDGVEWSYSFGYALNRDTFKPTDMDLVLNDTVYVGFAQMKNAVLALVDKIKNITFHEDYQVGNSYNLNLADKEQTLRKALGAYLWWNVGRYSYSTKVYTLSSRVEDIIADLVPTASNYFCYVYIDENLSGNEILRFYYVNTGGLSGPLNSKGFVHIRFDSLTWELYIAKWNRHSVISLCKQSSTRRIGFR